MAFGKTGCGGRSGLAPGITRAGRFDLWRSARHSSINGSTNDQLPAFFGSSCAQTTSSRFGHTLQADHQGFAGEGVELLQPDNRRVGIACGVARLHQVIGDLARTQYQPLHVGVSRCVKGSDNIRMKWLSPWKSSAFDSAILWRSNDFGVITISGLRKDRAIWRRSRVEIIGRRGAVGDLDVILGAQSCRKRSSRADDYALAPGLHNRAAATSRGRWRASHLASPAAMNWSIMT